MYTDEFKVTDPEFAELFEKFAYQEVIHEEGKGLEEKTRYMAILATLIGCQGAELYREVLKEALSDALTPVEAKEIVYQAVAYLGIGRVFPFLRITNEILKENKVELPLPGQATTTEKTRLEKGNQTQVEIFGEQMRGYQNMGPEETRHISKWLADNCFGDYYTRTGLDYKQREMITFCFLAAQGTEVQLKGHINGNILVGNDRQFLINVVSQCMPYIGYPRTLNALRCISEALDQK
ncbi:4-carboxymuconolactone decarboxylase [Lachnospiraceae bacterium KM106-2]|nr:4-carboxymuconolactone decarboxylase [Lachnospiraceae bacterium KM106-2]